MSISVPFLSNLARKLRVTFPSARSYEEATADKPEKQKNKV
jgi:hypothetical protein